MSVEQFEEILISIEVLIIPLLLLNIVGAYTILTLSMDISIIEINVILWRIHHLFIAIFSRGKDRDPLGYVYDTKSKEPLENAIVRVYSRSGRLVRTFITDKYGQFYGELEGEYSLKVTKYGYLFPTHLESGFGDYLHKEFYIGGLVDFKEFDVIQKKFEKDEIFLPIPGDKSYKKGTFVLRALSGLIFAVHIPLLFVGGGLSFLIYLYLPTVQTFIILAIYFVMLLNFIFYMVYERHRYGVLNDDNAKPVIGKLIQLYDKDGALFATRVTNEYGKFRFIVPKGEYSYHVDEEMIAITKDHRVKGIGAQLTLADRLSLKEIG